MSMEMAEMEKNDSSAAAEKVDLWWIWCSANVNAHMENRREVSLENKMKKNHSNNDNIRNSSNNETLQYVSSHGDTCL